MLILSRAKIAIAPHAAGRRVRVEGVWARYRVRIKDFFQDLPVERGTVRLRSGRILMHGDFDPSTEQRVRNFLVNECPVKDG